jgi:hypothetical protein
MPRVPARDGIRLLLSRALSRTRDQNRALDEKVFEDLERIRPPDLRYLVLDLKDGGFLHIATASEGKDTTSLTETAAFKRSFPITPSGAQVRWSSPRRRSSAVTACCPGSTDGGLCLTAECLR